MRTDPRELFGDASGVPTRLDVEARRTTAGSGEAESSVFVDLNVSDPELMVVMARMERYFVRTLGQLRGESVVFAGHPEWVVGGIEARPFRRAPRSPPPSFGDRRVELEAALVTSFEEHPVESGEQHPAEILLAEAIHSDRTAALIWLASFYERHPALRPALLLCIGRLPRDDLWSSQTEALFREALRDQRVAVRDAAVRGLELLGGAPVTALLRGHRETVPWLADYLARVISGAR